MRQILLSLILLNCFFSGFSQIQFASIKKVSLKKIEVLGAYTPSPTFLKRNPTFLQDGVYSFDILDYKKGIVDDDLIDYNLYEGDEKIGQDYKYYLDSKFSSDTYPVDFVGSTKKLSPDYLYQIRLLGDKLFPLGETEKVIIHPEELNSQEFVRNINIKDEWRPTDATKCKVAYNEFNSYYKRVSHQLIKEKGILHNQIDDLLTVQNLKSEQMRPVIVLEFSFKDCKAFFRSHGAPSYIRYDLRVKSLSDSLIAEYHQAFFFDAKAGLFYEKGIASVIKESLYSAMDILINRYLEDSSVQILQQANQQVLTHNPLLINYLSKLNELSYKKRKIGEILNSITEKLYKLGESFENPYADFKSSSQISSNEKLNAGVFAAVSLFNSISAKRDEKIAKKLKLFGESIIDSLKEYSKEMTVLKETVPEQLFNVFVPVKNTDTSNDDILKQFKISAQNAIKETSAQRKTVSSMLQSSLSEFSSTFNDKAGASSVNALTPQLNALNSPVNKSVPSITPETYAINKDAKLDQNVDPCMQKAYAEYYKSTEYKNWMNNKGIAAHSYEVQAKLVEVTLKYCKEQLPPDEYKMLVKLAADTRAVARDLRKTKGSGFVIGQ